MRIRIDFFENFALAGLIEAAYTETRKRSPHRAAAGARQRPPAKERSIIYNTKTTSPTASA